jgi:hypothetical protein
MGAIESILDVESFEWRSGDVSWGDGAGKQINKSKDHTEHDKGRYFISTVNRARMGAQYDAMYEEARAPARTTRRRK